LHASNRDYQYRIAFSLGKMPSHHGVHDHARVRTVDAFGAEKFTLLGEPADEFLEMLGGHSKSSVERLRRFGRFVVGFSIANPISRTLDQKRQLRFADVRRACKSRQNDDAQR
jgi:hypothetical protein